MGDAPTASSGCERRPPLFETVLVANRGEIACRVFRTLRRLGIRSVAVYSAADAGARLVALGDIAVALESVPRPPESYLNIERHHRGRGRPPAPRRSTPATGSWPRTRVRPGLRRRRYRLHRTHRRRPRGDGRQDPGQRSVAGRGVPVVPGLAEPGLTDDDLAAAITRIGYPALIKPSAGGGGKGMHVVNGAAEIGPAVAAARREASSSFGDDTLFVERLVREPAPHRGPDTGRQRWPHHPSR